MKQNVRFLMDEYVIYTVNFKKKKVLTKRCDYLNNINNIKIKSVTEKRVTERSQKEIRQFYHSNLKVNWKDTDLHF